MEPRRTAPVAELVDQLTMRSYGLMDQAMVTLMEQPFCAAHFKDNPLAVARGMKFILDALADSMRYSKLEPLTGEIDWAVRVLGKQWGTTEAETATILVEGMRAMRQSIETLLPQVAPVALPYLDAACEYTLAKGHTQGDSG